MYAITDQIEQERIATHGKGIASQLRELAMPGNRRRICLGVTIFVFMQMAGSNAINVSIYACLILLKPHQQIMASTTPPEFSNPSAS